MYTKLLLITLFMVSILSANTIEMTPEQQKNWQIKVKTPESTQHLPLGEFMIEAVTPPSLLHTISIPFEANIKKLYVAQYQKVTSGLLLAEVTGTSWIDIQQQAIADTTALQYHTDVAERKSILCKDNIIPQKECASAYANLETYKIKVATSKALLKSYGASDEMIKSLFKDLTLSPTMSIKSTVSGHVVALQATPGKRTTPSDALFVIQEKGALWLESNVETKLTKHLYEGQKIEITIDKQTFTTNILQVSPVINPINQTRQIRLALPLDTNITTGLRSSARFTIFKESLKVQKTSVIKNNDTQIVFVQIKDGFSPQAVTILAEDNTHYYIETSKTLQNKIAVDSVAILKNMLGGDDE